MILLTGAAGFIGSHLMRSFSDVPMVICDDFSPIPKAKNHKSVKPVERVDRVDLWPWLEVHGHQLSFVLHIGARTDTTLQDVSIFNALNLHYTQRLWQYCVDHSLPFIYASSAATYGGGEHGYIDEHDLIPQLKPLNPYGQSKQDFDVWALQQTQQPPFWAGLKFFNVYGPREEHKGRMASVIFHAFRQIQEKGSMQLFKSHKEGIADGHQSRDFIYVEDLVQVIQFLYKGASHLPSGIYNVGTGQARTFLDLVNATFAAMRLPASISFMDTPLDIRDTYQYFTEADMRKLRSIGYDTPFYSLEAGVEDYVRGYLMKLN